MHLYQRHRQPLTAAPVPAPPPPASAAPENPPCQAVTTLIVLEIYHRIPVYPATPDPVEPVATSTIIYPYIWHKESWND